MKQAAAKTTTKSKQKTPEAASPLSGLTLAVQLLDVTWRVALPIVGLTLLGNWLDRHLGIRPVLTLTGFIASIFVATLLVYLQVKAAYPDFFKKAGKKA